jgi:hypothetical protein
MGSPTKYSRFGVAIRRVKAFRGRTGANGPVAGQSFSAAPSFWVAVVEDFGLVPEHATGVAIATRAIEVIAQFKMRLFNLRVMLLSYVPEGSGIYGESGSISPANTLKYRTPDLLLKRRF